MSSTLRWGTSDLVMNPRGLRGFIVCHLVNLRGIPLHRIQFSLFPSEGVEFNLNHSSLNLSPFEEVVVIFPYDAVRRSQVQIMVLFTSDTGEILFLQENIWLQESSKQDLFLRTTWENIIPLLYGGDLTLGRDIVPSEFVELVQKRGHLELNLLGGPESNSLVEYSWAIFDPLAVFSFSPPNSIRIYATDKNLLHQMEQALPLWLDGSNHMVRNAANLGQSLTIMKNYVDLRWRTEDTLSLVRKIANLLTDLRLPVPWPVMQIEKLLSGTDSLQKLTDLQIASLNEMISTLERYVLLG